MYIFGMVTLGFSFIIIIFNPPTVTAIAESDNDKQSTKTIGAWVPSQFRLEYITVGNHASTSSTRDDI